MLKKVATFLMALIILLAAATPALAHEYERGRSDHILRYLAYPFHAVGIALEYTVTRPLHRLASQPTVDVWLGHIPTERDGDLMEWNDPALKLKRFEHIARQKEAKRRAAKEQKALKAQASVEVKKAGKVQMSASKKKPAGTAKTAQVEEEDASTKTKKS